MKPEDLPDLREIQYVKHNQAMEYNPRSHAFTADRPFTIFALLLDRTLGDFIYRSLFAATVKLRFRNSRLILYYRPDRPYKDDIIKINPYIFTSWKTSGLNTVPLDYFDYMGNRPVFPKNESWYKTLSAEPDLVLTPSMMGFNNLRGLTPVARFAIPTELAPPLLSRLLGAGLSEDRWFCVLHYRNAGYRPSDERGNRDLHTNDPLKIVDHIISNLGGQVVRIGHLGMSPISPRPGFIDISGESDPFMLHAYAVSRARFFLELSPSGPMALAGAFGVPVARCNAVSTLGPLEKPSFSLMQHIIGPTGERVPRDIAIAKGLYSELAVTKIISRYGYRFARNHQYELEVAATDIFNRTTDCEGWRSPGPPIVSTFPEEFTLPLPPPPDIEIVEYPDLIPVFS